jgi:phage/plasmid-like protein (TIGR03299 family)
MSHEILEHDHLVLVNHEAWHGLGTIVSEAPTPEEALKLARMDWTVKQDSLLRRRGLNRQAIEMAETDEAFDVALKRATIKKNVENYRSDTGTPLGVVGIGYKPVQNIELANFATALAQEGDVTRIETVGSLRNGRRVWFLIPAASFSAMPKDVVANYLVIANGHDGSLGASFWWTSTRIVCANTFRASLASGMRLISFRHEGDMEAKLKQAKDMIGLYHKSSTVYEDQVKSLVATKMTKDQIDEFVTSCLTDLMGAIPDKDQAAKNKRAAAKREKAISAYLAVSKRFDEERDLLHSTPNAWIAYNAVSGWLQHDRKMRGKTEEARKENAVYADQFGIVGAAKVDFFKRALTLV